MSAAQRADGIDQESVDRLLDRLETITARLGEAREPIEDLAVAYEEGLRLQESAGERLLTLQRRAGLPQS
ncbi:MAG: hypothetical protein M3Z13_03060 [Candidatus Dormibacteraeota bacterium]|nr:hypothetical protein [Candidatus Dormibacteraeota bacterium]